MYNYKFIEYHYNDKYEYEDNCRSIKIMIVYVYHKGWTMWTQGKDWKEWNAFLGRNIRMIEERDLIIWGKRERAGRICRGVRYNFKLIFKTNFMLPFLYSCLRCTNNYRIRVQYTWHIHDLWWIKGMNFSIY